MRGDSLPFECGDCGGVGRLWIRPSGHLFQYPGGPAAGIWSEEKYEEAKEQPKPLSLDSFVFGEQALDVLEALGCDITYDPEKQDDLRYGRKGLDITIPGDVNIKDPERLLPWRS